MPKQVRVLFRKFYNYVKYCAPHRNNSCYTNLRAAGFWGEHPAARFQVAWESTMRMFYKESSISNDSKAKAMRDFTVIPPLGEVLTVCALLASVMMVFVR